MGRPDHTLFGHTKYISLLRMEVVIDDAEAQYDVSLRGEFADLYTLWPWQQSWNGIVSTKIKKWRCETLKDIQWSKNKKTPKSDQFWFLEAVFIQLTDRRSKGQEQKKYY